ncbi:aspartate carbamoyltransferase catalytic subunit [Limosilactobacillus caecicola]|uniref:aspartate carbamoyltransferase catalytic subunit n=1 Tax=Limosilactobacillus caecicola TaxID=2941332 RepID=UPI00203D5B0B|nr:aspartate carbamoyltransferase catalytic subunit [Limosilactobacillus caecicola]
MDNFVAKSHFVSVENLSVAEINALIQRAEFFKQGGQVPTLTKPVYVTNMFFENSTRTHTSFAMAEKKLGLTEIPFDAAHSSRSKGETMYDTCLVMNALGVDLTVIRDSQNEYYEPLIHPTAGHHLSIGVVNAGDGSGQHPSQSLLDMMTIHEHFGTFAGLKVAIVGDITNSRVARSNMEILTRLGAEVYFSGPEYWYDHSFDRYGKYLPLDELVDQVDVMMLLRVQHERHAGDANEASFDEASYHAQYGINHDRYERLNPECLIMHPGPINHGVELAGDLVEAPKSAFFRQMQNGVFMRMAMLEAVLRGRHIGGLQ